ncbi:hypothetical protein Tco_1013158 [Tanacetum coccineum]
MDDTVIFSNANDDEDVGVETDFKKLETTINVSLIYTTRIDKDHPKDQIIRDFNSAIQTRRMTKIFDEHAMMDVKSAFLYGTIDEEATALASHRTNKGLVKDVEADQSDSCSMVKRIFRYLKGLPKLVIWYPRDLPFDLEAFSDSDYAGASLDRKSTTGGVMDSKSNA